MHITKWKETICKGYILYDSNYKTFWNRQKYGDSKKISGCQELAGMEESMGGAQGILGTVKSLYMLL